MFISDLGEIDVFSLCYDSIANMITLTYKKVGGRVPEAKPEDDDSDNDNSENEVDCPWQHCDGDAHMHNVLCLASKYNYSISWAFIMSRKELIDQFGYDVWDRDCQGHVTGLLKPEEYVRASTANR